MLSQEMIETIHRLHAEGESISSIAATVGCSTNTVNKHLSETPSFEKAIAAIKGTEYAELLIEDFNWYTPNLWPLKALINRDPQRYGLPDGFTVTVPQIRKIIRQIAPDYYQSKGLAAGQYSHVMKGAYRETYFEGSYDDYSIGKTLYVDYLLFDYTFAGQNESKELRVFFAIYPWSHKVYFRVSPEDRGEHIEDLVDCICKNGLPESIGVQANMTELYSLKTKNNQFHETLRFVFKELGIPEDKCALKLYEDVEPIDYAQAVFWHRCMPWVNDNRPNIKTIEELNLAIDAWSRESGDLEMPQYVELDGTFVDKSVGELFDIEKERLLHVAHSRIQGIAAKKTGCTDDQRVEFYGTSVKVPPQFIGEFLLLVVLANGKFIISSAGDKLKHYGMIPVQNIMSYTIFDRDQIALDSQQTKKRESPSRYKLPERKKWMEMMFDPDHPDYDDWEKD